MHRSAPLLAVVGLALLGACTDSNDASRGTSVADDPLGDEPPPTPEPLITLDTQEAMLEEVFQIYSGAAWDPTPLSLTQALLGVEGVFESTDSLIEFPDGNAKLILAANCRTGSGRLEADIPDSVGNFSWQARLDACVPDPERTDLALVSGSVDGVWNRDTSARSDDLAWTTVSGESVSFSGEILVRPDESKSDTIESFVTTNAHQILRDGSDDARLFSIEEATSVDRFGAFNGIEDVASLSGGFVYRSTLTGGQAVTVRTPIELGYYWDARTPAPDGVAPEDFSDVPLGDYYDETDVRTDEQWSAVEEARARWAFTAGMLELQAEDGSRLLLDADTGDFDTVRLTLDTGRGEGAEEHVIEWPRSWYRALAFNTRQMILGNEVTEGE